MRTSGRIGAIALLTLVMAAAPERADLAAPRGSEVAPGVTGPQEVEVVAVVTDPRLQSPAVLLQGKRDRRHLAMAIGHAEATGIALPLHGVTPPRPLTHDLFLTMFGRLKVTLSRVVITDFRDDIFFATVYLVANGAEIALDARPSDAIALAMRAKVPMLVEDRVFDKSDAGPAPRRPHI